MCMPNEAAGVGASKTPDPEIETRFGAVLRYTYNLEVLLEVEKHFKSITDYGLVITEEDFHN